MTPFYFTIFKIKNYTKSLLLFISKSEIFFRNFLITQKEFYNCKYKYLKMPKLLFLSNFIKKLKRPLLYYERWTLSQNIQSLKIKFYLTI